MGFFRAAKLSDAELELGAKLLCQTSAASTVIELDDEDAREIAGFMRPVRYAVGELMIEEGATGDSEAAEEDGGDGGFMLLILSGDATVAQTVVSRTEPFVVSMLGAGALIGEMSIVDNSPRAASVTAASDVRALKLSHRAFVSLLSKKPKTGVKLLLLIAQRLSTHLRDSSQKLFLYTQLVQAMDDEISTKILNTEGGEQALRRDIV
jgi:CRP/FNR family transcriptional regulator, cyclic AMP receptor protein